MRAVVTLVVVAACGLLAAPPVGAEPFLYQFTGSGAGTLAGAPFPLQGFRIRLLADTDDVTVDGQLRLLPVYAADFALDVSGAGNIATPVFTNVNQEFGSVVFATATQAILFFYDSAFGSYELDTPLGPIESETVGLQEIPLATSAGTLVFTAVPSLAFEAPEPAALAAGAAALGTLTARSLRRRSRDA